MDDDPLNNDVSTETARQAFWDRVRRDVEDKRGAVGDQVDDGVALNEASLMAAIQAIRNHPVSGGVLHPNGIALTSAAHPARKVTLHERAQAEAAKRGLIAGLWPPPEYLAKPYHFLVADGCEPDVVEWCGSAWLLTGHDESVAPETMSGDGYRYLGPAEWKEPRASTAAGEWRERIVADLRRSNDPLVIAAADRIEELEAEVLTVPLTGVAAETIRKLRHLLAQSDDELQGLAAQNARAQQRTKLLDDCRQLCWPWPLPPDMKERGIILPATDYAHALRQVTELAEEVTKLTNANHTLMAVISAKTTAEPGNHDYIGPLDADRKPVADPVHERFHGSVGDVIAGRVLPEARRQMQEALKVAPKEKPSFPVDAKPGDPRRMGLG